MSAPGPMRVLQPPEPALYRSSTGGYPIAGYVPSRSRSSDWWYSTPAEGISTTGPSTEINLPDHPATYHPPTQDNPSTEVSPVPDFSATPSPCLPIVYGCLLGGAIGDAVGVPLESLSLGQIRQKHGSPGVPYRTLQVPYALVPGTPQFGRDFDGRISEETQLALLTTEALLRVMTGFPPRDITAAVPRKATGIAQETYIAWLAAQGETMPGEPVASGFLAGRAPFTDRRGTSRTVIEAMHRAASRQRPDQPLGTTTQPVNNSKGSAAVVRVAACGFTDRVETAFHSGCEIAALTHGHPSAWLAAGTFAAVIHGLYSRLNLRESLYQAQLELNRRAGHEEVAAALAAAIALAGRGSPTAEAVESLGRGWTAPEALAIAVYAALSAEAIGRGPSTEILEFGLRLAVNHSGDSDATGALCGSLLGARFGVQCVPDVWAFNSEVNDLVYTLSRDFCIQQSLFRPLDYGASLEYWYTRYPG
ncbi:ADP-ribosylglycohydrolase family protein [Nocardia macrotermitis]|uniref:ADP-ribosylglycohydrolase n=1 Tax=Nocardia macrotermitis TaxID=2585198 RepID=A0A7K0D555_9NOCA|nr:ADP-ribosylglycohydrolase family protein [Nocardia macrotermitis]MQY19964.1 hypothetical protein [Nocardia macrotermitis]